MGMVYADVELINGGDLGMARRYFISDEEVRRMLEMDVLIDQEKQELVLNPVLSLLCGNKD